MSDDKDEYEELFDTVRAALRETSLSELPADGALDAIQFNLRTAEHELKVAKAENARLRLELQDARQGNALITMAAENLKLETRLVLLAEAAEAYRRDERNYARLDAELDKVKR